MQLMDSLSLFLTTALIKTIFRFQAVEDIKKETDFEYRSVIFFICVYASINITEKLE